MANHELKKLRETFIFTFIWYKKLNMVVFYLSKFHKSPFHICYFVLFILFCLFSSFCVFLIPISLSFFGREETKEDETASIVHYSETSRQTSHKTDTSLRRTLPRVPAEHRCVSYRRTSIRRKIVGQTTSIRRTLFHV